MGLLGKIMVKLGLNSSEFQKGINESKEKVGEFGSFLQSNLGKIVSAIGAMFAVDKIVSFGKEIFSVSEKSEGIRRAFERLNRPQLLDELRKATNGTVSDLELMTNAVKTNNFKIPLENLATYLKFATQRARETGESVDYLVQSIVLGVGRKSPLILDNLGISALEVREEFAKTGDMAKAVGLIIEREMSKSGESIEAAADKTDQLAASWDNLILSVGKTSVWTKSVGFIKQALTDFVDWFADWSNPDVSALSNFLALFGDGTKNIEKQTAELKRNNKAREEERQAESVFQELQKKGANLQNILTSLQKKELSGWQILLKTKIESAINSEKTLKNEANLRENSIKGISGQITALKELADVETDPKKKQGYAKQLNALEQRLEKEKSLYTSASEVRKKAAEEEKANFKYKESETTKAIAALEKQKDAFGETMVYQEAMLRLLREREGFIKDPTEYKNAVKLNNELERQLKLRKETTSDIQTGSEVFLQKQISVAEEELSKLNTTTDEGRKRWKELKTIIDSANSSINALPQNVFPVGSLDWFNKEIATATEKLGSLTGAELAAVQAAQAAIALLEAQKEGVKLGYSTELDRLTTQLGVYESQIEATTGKVREYWEALANDTRAAIAGLGNNLIEWGDLIKSGISDSMRGLGDAIGSGNLDQALQQGILSPMANMMGQLGEQLIAMGVAKLNIDAWAVPFSGPGMIAAGAALVALSQVAQSAMAKTVGSMGQSGGNANTFTGGYSNGGSSTRTAQSLQLVSPQSQTIVVKGEVSGNALKFVLDKEATRRKS